MANVWGEMLSAVAQSKSVLSAADSVANDMAILLVGRMHHVSSYGVLRALKRELQDYDSKQKRWKK